jgi:small subunit ribosomal protein S20
LANHRSALKRHRQSLVRRERNRAIKTRVKNAVKQLRIAIDSKDMEQADVLLKDATSVMDKAATKNVIHWRAAARRISRLNQAVNKLRQA